MKSRPNSLAGPFPTTQWSQVLIAEMEGTQMQFALDNLCRNYWRPIYSFARHQGCSPPDAEDITQAFFADVLESGYLKKADRERGKFRTFLIYHFRFFLSNYRAKGRAQKRGGGVAHITLDVDWAESKLELSDPRFSDPDLYFDRQWALDLLRHARGQVAAAYESKGKTELFEALKSGLTKTPDADQYSKWECDLEMKSGALRVALHRLRERFRSAIEEQILNTIADEKDLKEEMRHLRLALGHSISEA